MKTDVLRETFSSPRPTDLDQPDIRHQVVIIGAGPVGLACALDLAHRGVAVTVIERRDTVSDGSRAIAMTYRSMELLGQLGIGDRLLELGIPWESGRSFFAGQEISSFLVERNDDVQYPALINLQQPFVERFLVDACHAHPNVEIRWSTTVAAITPGDRDVTLNVSSPHGDYPITTDWLVAADGARSAARDAIGEKLHGTSYPNMFVIVDITMPSDRPAERLCWFDPPSFPNRTVLLHKQPLDVWRLDYQVPETSDIDELIAPETVEPLVAQHLAFMGEDSPWTLEWASVYRAHALSMHDYRHGRMLFIGDAAHLLPIFGVRGMNSGLVDAANLAWKLAYVVNHDGPESLLDTYSVDQRDAFDQNRERANKSTLFMTPGTPGTIATRDAALDLALVDPEFGALADPRYSSPINYRTSPLNIADDAAWAGGFAPGDLVPNVRVTTDTGHHGFLNDLIGRDFAVLLFGDDANETAGDQPLPYSVIRVIDPDRTLAQLFDASTDSGYLLRPDRHVMARRKHWTTGDAQNLIHVALAREVPAPPYVVDDLEVTGDAAADYSTPLERAWMELGDGIDMSGENSQKFLTRLALLLGNALNDPETFSASVRAAQLEDSQRK